MKKRREFYELFFSTIQKAGYKIKNSESADYIADIYFKNQIVAFYTRNDKIEKNPFVDVKSNVIDALNEKARSCALAAGICVDKPYDEKKSQKLPDGSYKLSEYNDYVLSCKYHHLFGYIFACYRLSPDSDQKMQRQVFYNKADALQSFAIRSGLINENLLFSETELKILHSNLIKMSVDFDKEMSKDAIKAVKTLVEKIEEIKPELGKKGNEFDFSKEFDNIDEMELGD